MHKWQVCTVYVLVAHLCFVANSLWSLCECVCMNRSVGRQTDWALAAIAVISNSCPLPIELFTQTCLHCAARPFPEDPTERERNRNAPLCHSFFSNLSLHPFSPSSLHFTVLLRADVSYHTAQRYVSDTHMCKQIHTLIITLRDMSTLSPFSRGQWEAFMHIKRTLFFLLPFF